MHRKLVSIAMNTRSSFNCLFPLCKVLFMWQIITMVCCILMWVTSIVRPHCTVSVAQEGYWQESVHPLHQWDCTAVHSCELLWCLQQNSCFYLLHLLVSFSYACRLLARKELEPYILSCILIVVCIRMSYILPEKKEHMLRVPSGRL